MSVSFDGIDEMVVTFLSSGSAAPKAGQPVKISGEREVADCGDGERFIGIAISEEDGCTAVCTRGYLCLPFSGAAPTLGYGRLLADGNGGVKAGSGSEGGEYAIVSVDSVNNKVGFFL